MIKGLNNMVSFSRIKRIIEVENTLVKKTHKRKDFNRNI
jgi:hypothetical protein